MKETSRGQSLGYEITQEALKQGFFFYSFRSGGGLRVLSLGQSDKSSSRAYGEGPNFEYALHILAKDFQAGGRKYEDVYGVTCPNYVTGQADPNSPIDAAILNGNNIRARWDGQFLAVVTTFVLDYTPKDVTDQVLATGKPLQSTRRGIVFESTPMVCANGVPGVSTRIITNPENKPLHYRATSSARAVTLKEAFLAALEAPLVEVKAGQVESAVFLNACS